MLNKPRKVITKHTNAGGLPAYQGTGKFIAHKRVIWHSFSQVPSHNSSGTIPNSTTLQNKEETSAKSEFFYYLTQKQRDLQHKIQQNERLIQHLQACSLKQRTYNPPMALSRWKVLCPGLCLLLSHSEAFSQSTGFSSNELRQNFFCTRLFPAEHHPALTKMYDLICSGVVKSLSTRAPVKRRQGEVFDAFFMYQVEYENDIAISVLVCTNEYTKTGRNDIPYFEPLHVTTKLYDPAQSIRRIIEGKITKPCNSQYSDDTKLHPVTADIERSSVEITNGDGKSKTQLFHTSSSDSSPPQMFPYAEQISQFFTDEDFNTTTRQKSLFSFGDQPSPFPFHEKMNKII